MNLFKFPTKKITLNCYTNNLNALELFSIRRAGSFLPDWWKQLPNTYKTPPQIQEVSTMKNCLGMVDLYQRGLMIPMWCDLQIEVGPKNSGYYKFQFSDQTSTAVNHAMEQRGLFLPDSDYVHLKLISPWAFVCNEEIDFMFSEPTWNMARIESYKVLPGVVDFKYSHATNINIMIPRTDILQSILIPAGQPMVHVAPFSDRGLALKISFDPNIEKYVRPQIAHFVNNYRTRKRILKADEAKGAKCPFMGGQA